MLMLFDRGHLAEVPLCLPNVAFLDGFGNLGLREIDDPFQ